MDWTTKTLQHGACTIKVHRPVLTSAEREKREQAVRGILENVMREYVKRKESKQ